MALKEEFEQQGKWLFRYRGILPLILLGIGLMTYLYGKYSNNSVTIWEKDYEFYYEIVCVLVSLIGLYIRILVVAYTSKNTSGRRVKTLNADVLNTSGAYSLVRHPLYLGNFFMWLGPALLTLNGWFIISFCAIYWIYYERIMFTEEQFLRSQFGSVYDKWSKNIPAFIPHFKNYKKLINKEDNDPNFIRRHGRLTVKVFGKCRLVHDSRPV